MAHGFASAGIPYVAATLWKADEHTIYSISQKFHEYLSELFTKDEALQKAKLYFIKNGEYEKRFPYYWANIVLIGNQEPISLYKKLDILYWTVGIVFIACIILVKRRFE